MNQKIVKVLIVDDNEDDVFLIRSAFEREGTMHPCAEARNGSEALKFLNERKAAPERNLPGMVLMDINMPVKNGFETLREIKADPALCHIPVVMLTTSKQEEDVVRAYSNGASTFISKPVGMENFRRLVRDFGRYWAEVAEVPDTREL